VVLSRVCGSHLLYLHATPRFDLSSALIDPTFFFLVANGRGFAPTSERTDTLESFIYTADKYTA
jgi:hypothetical protein